MKRTLTTIITALYLATASFGCDNALKTEEITPITIYQEITNVQEGLNLDNVQNNKVGIDGTLISNKKSKTLKVPCSHCYVNNEGVDVFHNVKRGEENKHYFTRSDTNCVMTLYLFQNGNYKKVDKTIVDQILCY